MLRGPRVGGASLSNVGVSVETSAVHFTVTLWTSTQIPHLCRTQVAIMLGMPENKLRLITPEVGGGFGSKLNVYAEEALISWIAMQTGNPIKWIEGRRENIQATIHGRGQTGYIEIGYKKDGTITGFRYNVFADMGAYHQLLTPAIPTLTGLMRQRVRWLLANTSMKS